jgi:hypothetical protein
MPPKEEDACQSEEVDMEEEEYEWNGMDVESVGLLCVGIERTLL